MIKLLPIVCLILLISCSGNDKKSDTAAKPRPFQILNITAKDASRLAAIPYKCVEKEYPYRLGQTLGSEADLGSPKKLHPAFYGCTNWNSAVLGYCSLTALLKRFPTMENADSIRQNLAQRLSAPNIQAEVAYFQGRYSKPFQRTGGWNSLLQLARELHTWKDTLARKLENNLQPLTNLIVNNYLEFLPKLEYSSKGTASGFAIAFDYATTTGNEPLKKMLIQRSKDFYLKDKDYKLSAERPEVDFASEGLQEVDIMRRILPADEFRTWLRKFLPELSEKNFMLEPAKAVEKRTKKSDSTGKKVDTLPKKSEIATKKFGKTTKGTDTTVKAIDKSDTDMFDLREEDMPRVDRLNFSRALCLIGIADTLPEYEHLRSIAYEHIIYSLPNVVAKDETKLKLLQMMFWF